MEEQQLDKRQLIAFLKAIGLQKDFCKSNLEHYQQLYNVYIDANRKGFKGAGFLIFGTRTLVGT